MTRPVHTFLVLAPAALLDLAFSLDLAGRLFGAPPLWTAGAHAAVAGIAAGLFAGLPAGIAGSRAAHGHTARFAALYFAGLALFALARWVRGHPAVPTEAVLVAAEGIADVLVAAGAWAGGFLDAWLDAEGRGGRRAAADG